MYVASGYLKSVFKPENLKKTVFRCERALRGVDYDCLAFMGTSGAAVTWPLSFLTGQHVLQIRKEGDTSHARSDAEGAIDAKKIVIIDDFAESGDTLKKMAEHMPYYSEVVAVVFYSDKKGMLKTEPFVRPLHPRLSHTKVIHAQVFESGDDGFWIFQDP